MRHDTSADLTTAGGRRQKLSRLAQRMGLLRPLAAARAVLGGGDLRILAYHRVLPEPVEDFSFDLELVSAWAESFREQMIHLRKRFHPMRFDEVLAMLHAGRRLPANAVLVTFDDGYEDNHSVAFPILRDLDLSAMFFVATGHIDSGRPYLYDWLVHALCVAEAERVQIPELELDAALPASLQGRRAIAAGVLDRVKALRESTQSILVRRIVGQLGVPVPDRDGGCRPMSWQNLREMRDGGMEIGSHGVHHRMLAKLPASLMKAELVESRRRMQAELGAPARVLSYPVGGHDAFDEEVIAAARAAGYEMACAYIAGTSRPGAHTQFALRRLPVERCMDQAWFEAVLAWPGLFIHRSRRRDASWVGSQPAAT
jgi:peptidoglycan/xylan/chitin deacetylase (PgdA/CDA1 family)